MLHSYNIELLERYKKFYPMSINNSSTILYPTSIYILQIFRRFRNRYTRISHLKRRKKGMYSTFYNSLDSNRTPFSLLLLIFLNLILAMLRQTRHLVGPIMSLEIQYDQLVTFDLSPFCFFQFSLNKMGDIEGKYLLNTTKKKSHLPCISKRTLKRRSRQGDI